MIPKLTVLICHTPDRAPFLNRLMENLNNQVTFNGRDFYDWGFHAYINGRDIDVIVDDRKEPSIGEKRNHLLSLAADFQKYEPGYLCFVDDDDNVAGNYFSLLLGGIATNPDCCSLTGVITEDGNNPKTFQHSIKYKTYETVDPLTNNGVTYLRYPNHLNCIRTDIAKQFKFPTINHGEDTDWATQIFKSGLLKTEFWIEPDLYYYEYRSKK